MGVFRGLRQSRIPASAKVRFFANPRFAGEAPPRTTRGATFIKFHQDAQSMVLLNKELLSMVLLNKV